MTAGVQCFGDSSAAILLDIVEGAAPFQYEWSNGAMEEDLMDLPAGDYTVTVSDTEGCTAVEGFNLTEPPALEVASIFANISCNGEPGFITLNAGGGMPPLSILWSNGATTDSISITDTGTYAATVTDANGCSSPSEYEIEEDDPLFLSLTLTGISCYGHKDGAASVVPLNGQAPFTFLWADGHIGLFANWA